tara:strand:+ start:10851 stop:11450 length:600 start_codon:yes stop_codon:yes gene_type:complete
MFDSVNSYYKFHSKIYDFTRWSILFGRNSILDCLPKLSSEDPKILDLGCGTGKHLTKLAEKYPEAQITGLDASVEMLTKAQAKISLLPTISIQKSSFNEFLSEKNTYDLILCSYSLSMFGDKTPFLADIYSSLKENGTIIVMDFDTTPFPFFERWMNFNHVQISGNLFNELQHLFKIQFHKTKKGYFGLWKYSLFIGTK